MLRCYILMNTTVVVILYFVRSEAQQNLFTLFKTYINSYKVETLHQREVLRQLYKQVVEKIDATEKEQRDISMGYLSIFKRIIDLYTTCLKSSLIHYKNSKIAYITLNKSIFQNRQRQIDNVHEKCRVMLREASKDLHGSFIDNCVKPQLLKVSESVELGEKKYYSVCEKVEAAERIFLTSTSEAFSMVAKEVRKSLNEFEYVAKDMIFEWNEMEEKITRVVRKDKASVLYDVKSCLKEFIIQHNRNLVPFFERYNEIEVIVVSFMMERYYSYVKIANNEEDSIISSKAPESVKSQLSLDDEQREKKKKSRGNKRKKILTASDTKTMEEINDKSKNDNEDQPQASEPQSFHHDNVENLEVASRKNIDDEFEEDVVTNNIDEKINETEDFCSNDSHEGDGSSEEDDGDTMEGNIKSGDEGPDDEEENVSDRNDSSEIDVDECDSCSDDDSCSDSDDDAKFDIRDEDGILVLPPNKCGLDYLLRLNKKIESYTDHAKAQIMGPIRDRFLADIAAKEEERKKQSFEVAQELVDKVAKQWTELHKDLQMLVSSHIVSARGMRSDMALKLWTLSDDFRKWELNRLAVLNEHSVWNFKKLRKPEMSRSDNKDLKIFERFARESQNVIVSSHVDLAPGHAEVMPAEMSTFLTQINTNPTRIRTEFLESINQFFGKSHSDDMHYNYLTTLEFLSNSLHDIRLQLISIVDDYEQDKKDTVTLLKYNSNVRRNVDPSLQVVGVLDTMVETVVARSAMFQNLTEQVKVTDRRSKLVEKGVHEFLEKNSFSDHFLADGMMDPVFIEDTALGNNDVEDCKLNVVSASRHGICLKCTAELFYTVKRSDVMHTSKITSVNEKLKGMVMQEHINGRIMRKQLHTLLKRACIEVDKVEFGIRTEIIGNLEAAFKARVDAGDTNSRVNEPADSIADRPSGPFVRDTDEIFHELVAAVKKPPRKEGMAVEYPDFSEYSDDDSEVTITTIQSEEVKSQVEDIFDHDGDESVGLQLLESSHHSVEDLYFNGIFQRTNEKRDGNPVLHGDKTVSLPVNPMEFPGTEVLRKDEEEIETFLRKHEEFSVMEKDLEQLAIDEEKDAIAEALLVASYNETQEALEAARLAEEERIREEEERKAAEREAIRLEAYEQAEMEFFQKYPDKDPNIYSYSNKFDINSLTYKAKKTMVNPKTYEEASDDYKDNALEKLLGIGGNPNKKSPYDLYVPPPEVPTLPLATVLARYQDLVSFRAMIAR